MQLKIFKIAGTDKRIAINPDAVQDVTEYYQYDKELKQHVLKEGFIRITFRNNDADEPYAEIVEGTFEEVVRKLSPVITDFMSALGL